jgi:hypothetical protein
MSIWLTVVQLSILRMRLYCGLPGVSPYRHGAETTQEREKYRRACCQTRHQYRRGWGQTRHQCRRRWGSGDTLVVRTSKAEFYASNLYRVHISCSNQLYSKVLNSQVYERSNQCVQRTTTAFVSRKYHHGHYDLYTGMNIVRAGVSSTRGLEILIACVNETTVR